MHKQNDASIRLFVFLIHADPSVSPCIIKIVFEDQAGLLRVELIVFLFRLFCTFPIGFLAKEWRQSAWCPLEDWLPSSSLVWPLAGACGSSKRVEGYLTCFLESKKPGCKRLVWCVGFFQSTGREEQVGQLGQKRGAISVGGFWSTGTCAHSHPQSHTCLPVLRRWQCKCYGRRSYWLSVLQRCLSLYCNSRHWRHQQLSWFKRVRTGNWAGRMTDGREKLTSRRQERRRKHVSFRPRFTLPYKGVTGNHRNQVIVYRRCFLEDTVTVMSSQEPRLYIPFWRDW